MSHLQSYDEVLNVTLSAFIHVYLEDCAHDVCTSLGIDALEWHGALIF